MKFSIFTVADHYSNKSRSLAQLYLEIEEQCVLAEQLNYYSFFVAEHHFHDYGVIPNPAVFLTALAKKTNTIKLGPAISILPFHNPLQIAEDYLMLNALSGGRLLMGLGSGYLQHEFDGYGIDVAEKRERFDENLKVLQLAFSKKDFSFDGKFFNCKNIKLNVFDENVAQPKLYVAVLRREAAYHVGKQGHNIICVPYASVKNFTEVKDLIAEYKKGYIESEKKENGEMFFAFHTHIAETDELARQNAEEAFNLYSDSRLYATKRTYADIVESELCLFGSVKRVKAKIDQLKEMGISNVLLLMNFGMLEQEKVKKSMALFAEIAS